MKHSRATSLPSARWSLGRQTSPKTSYQTHCGTGHQHGVMLMGVHELSISHTISRIATRAAQGRDVKTIHLDIGQMRQIIPETLAYCWNIVREDEVTLKRSELDVRHIPVRFRCLKCGHETQLEGYPMLLCGECASNEIDMLSGEEFLLRSMDLFDEESS